VCACSASQLLLVAQTTLDLRTQAKNVDFTQAAATKPNKSGTALPASCGVGETFFLTTAAAGQNLYGCTAANAWSPIGANTLPATVVQTNQSNAYTGGAQNFSAAAATFPVQTGTLANRPGSCTQGQHYFATDAAAADGARLYGCSPANVWVSVGFGRGTLANRPGVCAQGDIYFGLDAAAGQNLYFCTVTNSWTQMTTGSAGLADPGSNGILKRTALNTTAAAVAGTDYYAPGSAIASSDLPFPGADAKGGILTSSCGSGYAVDSYQADGAPHCAPITGIQFTGSTPADTAIATYNAAGAALQDSGWTLNVATGLSCPTCSGPTYFTWTSGTTPATDPGAGNMTLFVDSADMALKAYTHAGTVVPVGAGSTTNQRYRYIQFSFDGQGSAITATTVCKGVDFSGTINQVTLTGDVSGSATVDLLTETHANYITSGPAGATSITNTHPATIASAYGGTVAAADMATNSWTTTLASSMDMCAAVSSIASTTRLNVLVRVTAN